MDWGSGAKGFLDGEDTSKDHCFCIVVSGQIALHATCTTKIRRGHDKALLTMWYHVPETVQMRLEPDCLLLHVVPLGASNMEKFTQPTPKHCLDLDIQIFVLHTQLHSFHLRQF